MAERSTFYVFRESSLESIIAMLQQVASGIQKEIIEADMQEVSGTDYVTVGREGSRKATIFLPFRGGTMGKICYEISKRISDSVITIRMQEGAIWDYTLMDKGTVLDNFSVAPNYWDSDDSRLRKYDSLRGNSTLVARTWNIPEERINKYIVDWGWNGDPDNAEVGFLISQSGKAYLEDRFPYGDVRQALDFMHSLGGHVYSLRDGGRLFYVPAD